jgi:hypothetical protein
MQRQIFGLLLAALFLPGCLDEPTVLAPRDVTPPAAPRGLYSVTGDGRVTLHWLANTEPDVAGYHVYVSPCARGGSCRYDPVGTAVWTTFVIQGLPNGVTRYYAVAAFDDSGNESDLSEPDVFDTPRPAGTGVTLRALQDRPALSGWDFSAYSVRAWDDPRTDMYFSTNGSIDVMLTPDPALTGIQDMGFATTLDAVDFAPPAGWSPTGSVELIVGHNYVVWTQDDHFAKFRVTGLGGQVVFDWAYQIDTGNGELRAKPVAPAGAARPNPAAGLATPARFLTPVPIREG